MKSLYVHIPFCKQKCLYCDFNSYSGKEKLIDSYCEALKTELQSYSFNAYKTIYFGGGTPSYIDEKSIIEILNLVNYKEATEITIEVNPGTVTKENNEIKYPPFGFVQRAMPSSPNSLKLSNTILKRGIIIAACFFICSSTPFKFLKNLTCRS